MLLNLGVNSVSLAVRYLEEKQAYPGVGLMFRNNVRKLYISEESPIFWNPSLKYYEKFPREIVPSRSLDVQGDVAKKFSEACRSRRKLNCVFWFPVLRMDHAVRANPEYGVKDIYDSIPGYKRYFACPNNPTIRDLVKAMVEDLVVNYDFNELELDYIRYPDVPSSVRDPFIALSSMPCFCKNCSNRARELGLDLSEIKSMLRSVLNDISKIYDETGLFCASNDIDCVEKRYSGFAKWLLDNDYIRRWLEFRAISISNLVEVIRDTIMSYNKNIELSADLKPPSESWLYGQDYKYLGRSLNKVKIMMYTEPFNRSPSAIPYEIAEARKLLPPFTKIIAGIAVWPPQTPSTVKRDVELALKANVDGIYMYSYGWSTRINLITALETMEGA